MPQLKLSVHRVHYLTFATLALLTVLILAARGLFSAGPVAAQSAPTAAPLTLQNYSNEIIAIRYAPDIDSPRLSTVNGDDTVFILGRRRDGWLLVRKGTVEGWLYNDPQIVHINGELTTAILLDVPTYTPLGSEPAATSDLPMLHSVKLQLNIRSGPGTQYNILDTVKPGESVLIIARNDDSSWWQVQKETVQGWVVNNAEVMSFSGDSSAIPFATGPTPTTDYNSPPTATPYEELPTEPIDAPTADNTGATPVP